ncbi:DddA-like double-stranded DNA deaminase toxin [Glycomyces sp. NPDC021274]|uniref:DddA-like double-stranded DNA deaminase toxin n=1 Tax=Glycomyces sp. NPDC021274 TaxID=3155120 RepID=UPI0033DFA011
MASIEALTAAIRTAITQTRQLLADLRGSQTLTEELRDQLADLGVDAKAAQVSGVAAGLEACQAQTSKIASRLEAALAAAEAARAGRALSGGESSPSDIRSRNADPPWTRQPPVPGFTHRRPVAECIDAVRREGWPRNAQGRTSARGFLYTGDGRPVNAETFRPHRKGHAPPCGDLREPWRSDEHYTTTWHAERDAAAEMRRWKLSEAVLYLNVPTCGKESGDPYRCDVNLEKILPEKAVLFVWTVHEDGSRSRRRYIGTGEAIDD